MYFMVQDGPLDVPAARLDPHMLLHAFRDRPMRIVLFGYLDHMWELYAMWVHIPVFLAAVYGTKSLIGDSLDLASFITFGVFLAGAVGSVATGYGAERFGRTATTSLAMSISGGSALFIGFLPMEWQVVILIAAIVLGASVVADSAQFSTALSELCKEAYRGTSLTLQTGLGFLITIVPIWLVPIVAGSLGWGVAFAILAIGPASGTVAMLRLR